jgi:hypothetical protein
MNRAARMAALLLVLVAGPALAQTAPQTLVPAPAPPTKRPDTPGGAASQGVIRPPARVDPGIRRKPPAVQGVMPVIPPPGSPGGNPHVKPK